MTMTTRLNGTVRWAHLIAGLGGLAALLSSILIFAWSVHAANPHKDAINRSEMRQFEKRIDAGFRELGRRLDNIDNKLERKK